MDAKYKKKIQSLMNKHNIKNHLCSANLVKYIAAAEDIFPEEVFIQIKKHCKIIVFSAFNSGYCLPVGVNGLDASILGCKYVIILAGASPNDFDEEDGDELNEVGLEYVADVLYTLAHEIAHAWRLGGLSFEKILIKKDRLKEECATNALAKKWGFESDIDRTRIKKTK